MQLRAMMQASPVRAKDRSRLVVATLAALLAMATLALAAGLAVSAAQEMSGLRMASASAASLVAVLSLMVGIHSLRS